MASNARQTVYITYEPSGATYNFIPPLLNNDAYMPDPNDTETKYGKSAIETLKSHGYDASYPGQFCDALIFGGSKAEIDAVIHRRSSNIYGYEVYDQLDYNLNTPVAQAYPRATSFTGGEEFGQDETSTVPSQVFIRYVGGDTRIEWYYNGNLLSTDVITGVHLPEFKLAIKEVNKIISGYSYVWSLGNTYWTSGDVSTPEVVEYILKRKGKKGGESTVEGWENPDDPDNPFILSDLISNPNLPGYDNLAYGEYTISGINNALVNNTYNQGGYLGTDFITFFTQKDSSAEAWDYLVNDPASDGAEFDVPSSDEHEYKIVWDYTNQKFIVYKDSDFVVETSGQFVRQSGSAVYIGTRRDSPGDDPDPNLGWGIMIRTGGGEYQYTFYRWIGILPSDTDINEYDFTEAYLEDYNGYDDDPDAGEEENPQKDADEMEDPLIDPLATGFVYAFNVDTNDMTHLVEALNHDTLAGKIKDDFGNHLFDFIVSYHTMPCVVTVGQSRVGIEYRGVPFVYGEADTPLTLAQISTSWYKVDLDSKLCLPQKVRPDGFENWSQAQVQMYLPFIGTVHLNTADVWGKYVHVVYYFDVLAGSCVACIGVEGKGTLYTYESSCSYKIPFTTTIDQSMQNIMAGIMSAGSAVMGTVTSAMTGNVPGAISSAMSGAGAVGSFVAASEHKALISRGGQLGGSGGWHTPRSPALIITIPDVTKVTESDYLNINGYPTHVSSTLASFKNKYVEVGQINLQAVANADGAVPSDDELNMIRAALKEGVYV